MATSRQQLDRSIWGLGKRSKLENFSSHQHLDPIGGVGGDEIISDGGRGSGSLPRCEAAVSVLQPDLHPQQPCLYH